MVVRSSSNMEDVTILGHSFHEEKRRRRPLRPMVEISRFPKEICWANIYRSSPPSSRISCFDFQDNKGIYHSILTPDIDLQFSDVWKMYEAQLKVKCGDKDRKMNFMTPILVGSSDFKHYWSELVKVGLGLVLSSFDEASSYFTSQAVKIEEGFLFYLASKGYKINQPGEKRGSKQIALEMESLMETNFPIFAAYVKTALLNENIV